VTNFAAFYNWQVEHGKHRDFAERTSLSAIALLLETTASPELAYLDLGCGSGSTTEGLYTMGLRWSRYVGVDGSDKAVSCFNCRGLKNATVTLADATELDPFCSSPFDVVLCLFLLQDLKPMQGRALLADVPRVLKPNGKLLLSLTAHPTTSKVLGDDYRPAALAAEGIPPKYTYLWGKPDLRNTLAELGYLQVAAYEKVTDRGLEETYLLLALDSARQTTDRRGSS